MSVIPIIIKKSVVECEHANDPAKVAARVAMSAMKKQVCDRNTLGTTREVLNSTLSKVDRDTKMKLPGINIMSRNIRKWRSKAINAPTIPETRTGFTIPQAISVYPDGSKFVVYDSGPTDPNSILIFSSDYGLKELANADHIATDGTFKLSPNLWTQLITVHAVYQNAGSIPFVFGLLPDKAQSTYERFFRYTAYAEVRPIRLHS